MQGSVISEQATYTCSSEDAVTHTRTHTHACTVTYVVTYTNQMIICLLLNSFLMENQYMLSIAVPTSGVQWNLKIDTVLNRDRWKAQQSQSTHTVVAQLKELTYRKWHKCLAYNTGTWQSLTVAPSLDDKNLGYFKDSMVTYVVLQVQSKTLCQPCSMNCPESSSASCSKAFKRAPPSPTFGPGGSLNTKYL